MNRYSKVNIRENDEAKTVSITGEKKPSLRSDIIKKWQSLIDNVADLMEVPSALIMKLNEKNIEVFLKSNSKGNPYKEGEKAELIYGLYCETVIGTQKKLLVPNALTSKIWKKNNPDVDINMISYLGFPINWPDGEVFGTVCVLDNKENSYSSRYEELLKQIKLHVESDLNIHCLVQELEEKNRQLEQSNIIKSKLLSLVSHDMRGSITASNGLLNMIIDDIEDYDSSTIKALLVSLSESTNSTHQALEDVLAWSKDETLLLKPQIENIDIRKLIETLLASFKVSAGAKDISIKTEFDLGSAHIQTDRNMLMIVLRNIISNAIKYSNRSGDISISAKSNGKKTEVIIKDTGCGMTEHTLSNLFEYDINHGQGANGESSAGIGLILTNEFVKRLGGEISVESEIDKGSTFKVTL